MPPDPEERRLLEVGATRLSVALTGPQLEALIRFTDLLDTWRRRINLVSVTGRDELLARHVLDSLAPAPHVSRMGAPRMLDVGSGGGLPGVPLAIACPAARVTLLEPRRKRLSFLRAVVRECFTWNIDLEAARSEDLLPSEAAGFDVVVSRATFPLSRLPTEVGPLVRPGGLLIGFARRAQPLPGSPSPGFEAPPTIHAYDLPGVPGAFSLAVWVRGPRRSPGAAAGGRFT